jgi:hypothetical protein
MLSSSLVFCHLGFHEKFSGRTDNTLSHGEVPFGIVAGLRAIRKLFGPEVRFWEVALSLTKSTCPITRETTQKPFAGCFYDGHSVR